MSNSQQYNSDVCLDLQIYSYSIFKEDIIQYDLNVNYSNLTIFVINILMSTASR